MSKTILTPILAVIDLVLLIVIITSSGSPAVKTSDEGNSLIQAEQETQETASLPASPDGPAAAAEIPDISQGEDHPAFDVMAMMQESAEDVSRDEAVSEEPAGDDSQDTDVSEEPAGDTAQQEPEEGHLAGQSDISVFDTTERPTAADFTWITKDIVDGICPAGSEDMDFPEALGGWKCYIWDEEGIERFANMDFSGTEEDLRLTFDWFYVYVGSKGEGYDDNTPDSVYEGSLVGDVEAYGPGMVRLTDFYKMDGHQYAFGSIHWPDGISGHLTLVRP